MASCILLIVYSHVQHRCLILSDGDVESRRESKVGSFNLQPLGVSSWMSYSGLVYSEMVSQVSVMTLAEVNWRTWMTHQSLKDNPMRVA